MTWGLFPRTYVERCGGKLRRDLITFVHMFHVQGQETVMTCAHTGKTPFLNKHNLLNKNKLIHFLKKIKNHHTVVG